jgi:hypothetical protein
VTNIRVLNFIIQFVSNVFNPSNVHVVGFQHSRICPYHSLSKNLPVNIWFLSYKFNTSLYNNCHSSRQPLFIVNPHFLPTRNIPLEQKSQSQSTAQQPEPGPLWGPPELGPGDEDGNFTILKFATKLPKLSRGLGKICHILNVQFRVRKCQACNTPKRCKQ